MKPARRIYITDCEGPVSKNDNAFELTAHFIPEGEKLFSQISRYDDVLADVVKRDGYNAGDTLKLIVPFLRAYNITDEKVVEFSSRNLLLMPGARHALKFIRDAMPSFIVSTSYEHYIKVLCSELDFPYEDTYSTALNIDQYQVNKGEQETLKRFRQEIVQMPLIRIPQEAASLQDLSQRDRQTIMRLDEIFWGEISCMNSGIMLREVNPVGGVEKANAVEKIVDETGTELSSVLYVGDSITDVECLRLVRENGGVAASFNGNAYAIREAEIAVLSTSAIVMAVIAHVFNSSSNDSVFNLIDDWTYTALEKYDLDPALIENLRKSFKMTLPKVGRITVNNMTELAIESSAFRKSVRGEKVGRLG